MNPDLSVNVAGGYIIQLLPGADEATIEKLEKSIEGMRSVTQMLADGISPEDMIKLALKDFEVEVLYTQDVAYKCNCSKQRVEKALISIGREELKNLADEQDTTEVKCHFCDKTYNFSKDDLLSLAKNS